ncbi:GFA family protein [Salinispirillum sp. LH 10-3-1]|uniref:GFA family protein n=1 Tax=Salinispirillum sp. LH 10-3-1 TaxID=2952525 RepID=A0AB38YIV8_9GAMM
MHNGNCLCGQVSYELNAEPDRIDLCHCSVCRKAHGSVLSAGASVPAGAFNILTGEALLHYFESSPGKRRYFCRNCGTHLFARTTANPDVVRLRVATLNTDLTHPVVKTLHLDSAPHWFADTVQYQVPPA